MNQGLIPAKWAALTPRGEAIVDVPNSRRMNWTEFDGLVRRLANGLRGLGLEKGDRFAVLSRNCGEYMALYFAAGDAHGQDGVVAERVRHLGHVVVVVGDGVPVEHVLDGAASGHGGSPDQRPTAASAEDGSVTGITLCMVRLFA